VPVTRLAPLLLLVAAQGGCQDSRCQQIRDTCSLGDNDHCGPSEAVVKRVIDGDTVELESGEKVRYIGVDTPERGKSGYDEATEFNRNMVEGKEVHLEYDQRCTDQYNRLLAYVCADSTMVNEELIREGHAKTLHIKPNTCNKDELDRIYDGY